MSLSFRAHFDGKFLVPDEPVDLPIGRQVAIQVLDSTGNGAPQGSTKSLIDDRRARFRAFAGGASVGGVPLDALRRENLYEDRGPFQPQADDPFRVGKA